MQKVILITFILVLCATSITSSKDDFGYTKTNEEELKKNCNLQKMTTEFWKYFSGGFSYIFQNTTRKDLLEEVGNLCNDKDGCNELKYPTLCNGLSDKLIHLSSNLCARKNIFKKMDDNIKINCNEMATEFWKYFITSDLARELILIYENCEEYAILCYGLDENFINLSSGLCGR